LDKNWSGDFSTLRFSFIFGVFFDPKMRQAGYFSGFCTLEQQIGEIS
jgi:hypothetical protein